LRTFQQAFGHAPAARATAPGRVNLLGEHTDYNEGFVLPTAIPQYTSVEVAPARERWFRLESATLDERVRFAAGEPPPAGFGLYVYGCIQVLRNAGADIPPLDLLVTSDVPMGVGLSSSAALEVATLRAVRELLLLPFSDLELARLAHRAETDFAGVRCGILDQMACSVGTPGEMLFIDTRSLEVQRYPLPAEVLVVDTGTPRSLASTGYNQRRAECESAARLLRVPALRDVADPADVDGLPPPLDGRARHVVEENRRVLAARTAPAEEFGRLMNESHASLRDDFQVSTPALDLLAAILQEQPGIHGARLTGAGFGGACVALAADGAAEAATARALEALKREGFRGQRLV